MKQTLTASPAGTAAVCPLSGKQHEAGLRHRSDCRHAASGNYRGALGTDGCASNNNLDLFTEMNTTAKIHKVRYR
jgi:cytosine/adenosine deaminase-related metal-dependent hydrolase